MHPYTLFKKRILTLRQNPNPWVTTDIYQKQKQKKQKKKEV